MTGKARFQRFYENLGKPEYGPDFRDAQIHIMADPHRNPAERVLAWSKFRAWTNHSAFAIRLDQVNGNYVEELLTQKDCAYDLAWLEAGNRPEWLDAPRERFRVEVERHG